MKTVSKMMLVGLIGSGVLMAGGAPKEYPAGAVGELVKLGEEIILHTNTHPLTKDLVGNKLACVNCHLKGADGKPGTSEGHISNWLDTATGFPAWSKREKSVQSLQDRANNCFMRSMNGKRPIIDTEASMAIAAYITWLAEGKPMKILLLEDDYLYRMSIKDFLLAHDYEVDDVEDGDEALDLVYENRYAMLLLDIRVPGMDGYALLKQIREDGMTVPVIMLTSLTDIEDLSLRYELGCSDYLRKPFELKELKYRIEHIIRQDLFGSKQKNIEIGAHHIFDAGKEILYRDGERIELSGIETKLVSFLVQNKGYYASIEMLKENVWTNRDVTDADIRMCVKRAREKCGKSFIQTKRMVGYRIGD